MLKTLSIFFAILLLFCVALLVLYSASARFRFNAIVIHHTASTVDNYQSVATYQRREHGWRDAAYHLILSNGSTHVPYGYLEATGRYRFLSYSVATKNMYYNVHAIHNCVVGDYDKQELPEAMQAALVDVLWQLQEKYGISGDKILFHRDCSSSSCPGRFISKAKLQQWLASEKQKCPLSLSRQHQKVIGARHELIYSVERRVDEFSCRAFAIMKKILISFREAA